MEERESKRMRGSESKCEAANGAGSNSCDDAALRLEEPRAG